MPCRAAINLVVQCVEPSSGLACNVSFTTASTVPSGSHDLRPRPAAITPTPSTPASAKRARHRRTVLGVVAHRRAISSFATPALANNKPLAWTTLRCGNDDDFVIASNATRSRLVSFNGAATATGIHPT